MRFINALVACSVIAITSSSVMAQSTAVQWTVASGGNGHWYEVISVVPSETAEQHFGRATALGGHTATFSSAGENSFCFAVSGDTDPFIGVRKQSGNNVGAWITDEPWQYSNWHGGEGNNSWERYVRLNALWGGQWQDTDLTPGRYSVVEWESDCNNDGIVDYGQCLNGTLPDYNGNNIPDCCEQGVACVAGNYPVQWHETDGGNDHWYQGVTTEAPVSWTSARARAVALGSQLAAIGSRAEDDFVARLALENPLVWPIAFGYGPWLGGYQTSPSTNPFANWAWVTGEPWSYVSDVVEFDNSSRPDGQTDDYLHYINHSRVWNDVRNDGDTYYSIGIRAYMAEWSADCNSDGIVDYGQILSGQLIDANGDGIPDVCDVDPCPGDISGNGAVDGVDLSVLLGVWGTDGSGGEFDADVTNDGIVNGADLTIILGGWGSCPN